MNTNLLLKLLRYPCFCILFCLPAEYISAQTQNEKLEQACKRMFDKGYEGFIIAQAFKDGFITEGNRFHYQFFAEDSLIKIDEKPIPEPYQTSYKKLLLSFKAAHPTANLIGSLRCDGIHLSDILSDPPSIGWIRVISRDSHSATRRNR